VSSEPCETSHEDHLRSSAGVGGLGFAVVTLSDTRTEPTDRSGQWICQALAGGGHDVVRYKIVREDATLIRSEFEAVLADETVHIVVSNGGTGISLRDSAYEVLNALLEKRLDGFGEIFRMLSFQQIGSSAMLSRAVAGIAQGKIVFALPGSTAAVRLGVEQLILPQAAHLYQELHKQS